MRSMAKPPDAPHYHLDQLVQALPRLWGGVITVLAMCFFSECYVGLFWAAEIFYHLTAAGVPRSELPEPRHRIFSGR